MDASMLVVKTREYDVCVWLHTAKDPPTDEWKAAMGVIEEAKRKRGDSGIRSLVVTDGGAPNATQRGELSDLFDRKPFKLAVVTISLTNPIKRGIATAISWINPAFRAVPPSQLESAMSHLDLPGQFGLFLPALDTLQTQMVPVITLQMLKNAEARKR